MIYSVFFAIVLSACNDTSRTPEAGSSDSTAAISKKNVEEEDDELTQIIDDYVRLYQSPFLVDSSYVLGNDTLEISLKHTCLMDSSVIVPKKYVALYKLDSFVTHNFSSTIKVEKDHNVILERHIDKEDFGKFLDPNLKRYGVLLYPSVKASADSVAINYSISIPLSDIGIGVKAVIKSDGSISFMQR